VIVVGAARPQCEGLQSDRSGIPKNTPPFRDLQALARDATRAESAGQWGRASIERASCSARSPEPACRVRGREPDGRRRGFRPVRLESPQPLRLQTSTPPGGWPARQTASRNGCRARPSARRPGAPDPSASEHPSRRGGPRDVSDRPQVASEGRRLLQRTSSHVWSLSAASDLVWMWSAAHVWKHARMGNEETNGGRPETRVLQTRPGVLASPSSRGRSGVCARSASGPGTHLCPVGCARQATRHHFTPGRRGAQSDRRRRLVGRGVRPPTRSPGCEVGRRGGRDAREPPFGRPFLDCSCGSGDGRTRARLQASSLFRQRSKEDSCGTGPAASWRSCTSCC